MFTDPAGLPHFFSSATQNALFSVGMVVGIVLLLKKVLHREHMRTMYIAGIHKKMRPVLNRWVHRVAGLTLSHSI